MLNSRDPKDLQPYVEAKALAFQAECTKAGIDIIFTSTTRDVEAQNALYAQGRTKGGKIVTNAKGGDSYHNWGLAFDFVPVVNGKAVWDDNDLWARCGKIGQAVGLEWGGAWKKFPDKPHMQYTGGITLAELKSGKKAVLA